ncbi:FKBP-type peptidyl-prolyl cis-trans isomerase [Jatrophihabitans sp. YIM 134969]
MFRTSWFPLTAAGLAVVLLAGCGSDGDGRTVTNQAPNPSVARSLEPTPAPPSVAGSPTAGADGAVSFAGVTVTDALDLSATPEITATNTAPAPGLLVQDLVVGTGATASSTSTVTLHYVGALYSDGKEFDSDFTQAAPEPRKLGDSIAGFAQGVGGTEGVTPMKVGGRRLLVFPASLGYGPVPQDAIPAHSSLVFLVDLLSVS